MAKDLHNRWTGTTLNATRLVVIIPHLRPDGKLTWKEHRRIELASEYVSFDMSLHDMILTFLVTGSMISGSVVAPL